MRLNNFLLLRIRYRLGLFVKTVFFKVGLGGYLLRNRYGERILVFHGVDSIGSNKYNSRFTSKDKFDTLIGYITKHYNIISLNDYYDKKFKLNVLNLALTFDDGYLNNYNYVIPILKKYNIPASFYITTIHGKTAYLWADYLDLVSYHSSKKSILLNNKHYKKNHKNEFVNNGMSLKDIAKKSGYCTLKKIYSIFNEDWLELPPKKYNEYWELMTPKQINEISKHPLFTIGAHGETHLSLTNIKFEDAKHEITKSKKKLEKICGHSITAFAFPFGHYNQQLISYCETIGFKHILLVDYNSKEDAKNKTCRSRFVMNPYISLKLQLAYLLQGSYF